jgi:FtsP/CotA-like multicopper oxidase with cupredoxin domain
VRTVILSICAGGLVAACLGGAGSAARAAEDPEPAACPRPPAGSLVRQVPGLFSRNGKLNVTFEYRTATDADGRTLFCFQTPDGTESPTLHVHPGDTLHLTLINRLPPPPPGAPGADVAGVADACGAADMDATSVNIHFHGTNTRPVCHADQVVHTLVNAGQTFRYDVTIPRDEPPGLYWYHPHVHGLSEAAVEGGATGAIIVEGIENVQPAVAGLPERLLLVRDQSVAGGSDSDDVPPAWDLTLNYVPIPYPQLTPAAIDVAPGRREFWRVANTAADTIVDLELNYDGVAQPLTVVGLDGVPTGSQDGTREGRTFTRSHIFLPPAGRAEFIMATPSSDVLRAVLTTRAIDTGPDGDNDPRRVLAVLHATTGPAAPAADALRIMPQPSVAPVRQRFESIDDAPVAARRRLFFSEVISDPSNPASPTNFYITVDGAPKRLFSADEPPAIVTRQGQVEEWTIENRSGEVHEFHIHQIHFQLRERDHVPVSQDDRQFLDTVQVPYWRGKGYPYPSVTVAMDFRGAIAGDFVYHCHILGHEDAGMMAVIRVLPRAG